MRVDFYYTLYYIQVIQKNQINLTISLQRIIHKQKAFTSSPYHLKNAAEIALQRHLIAISPNLGSKSMDFTTS